MNRDCICDESSDFTGEQNQDAEQETLECNRIFLNFSRECRHPARDKFNMVKVKELFKYLSERQDLQEMKVSGWLEEGEPKSEMEVEDEEEVCGEKDGLESYFEDRSTFRGGGQRFAMSRDFWYRKLNTLKAQKLDEVALEAKDMPPDDDDDDDYQKKLPKGMKWVTNQKVFSSQVSEKRKDVLNDIEVFDKSVAKPVEKELRKRFVNVYDNRKHFTGGCN